MTASILADLNLTKHQEQDGEIWLPQLHTAKYIVRHNRMIKCPKVAKMQHDIKLQVQHVYSMKGVVAYSVQMDFIAAKYYWTTKASKVKLRMIDLTNIYKPVEDSIIHALGLNDCMAVEQVLRKAIHPDRNFEGVIIKYLLTTYK